MLSGQCAPLLSASHASRRACTEAAAARAHRCPGSGRHATHHQTVCRPRLSPANPSRAMHTTPPPPSLAASPTSSCRWKRGRPVASSSHVYGPRRDSGTCAQPSTTPAPGARVRPGLWDPSQALRFAPPPAAEAYHTARGALATDTEYPSVDVHATAEQANPRDTSATATSGEIGDEASTYDSEQGTSGEPEPLSYQIPEDKLNAAMRAAPKTRASYWSTKLYQGPAGEALNIHYCKSKDVAERVAKKFLGEKVVGFDIEWKPFGSPSSIKQNASLIQLACEDRIALFHIALFEGTTVDALMPPSLKAVLESPTILKVGVAIKGDFSRLAKFLGIQAQGVFELSRLHNLVQWYEVDPKQVNNKLVGLAAQVHQHLQLPLYKGEPLDDDPSTSSSVRESDWSLGLNLSQIHYAAADAYAGFRLYDTLERKRTHLKPTPSAISVCDYDNMPKPKAPRKTKKKPVASSEAGDVAATSTVDESDEKESDEYDTAPEEFITSQELKASELTLSLQRNGVTGDSDASPGRRVGRIKLPTLRGPDPAYPILPRTSTPNSDRSIIESDDSDMPDVGFTRNREDMDAYKVAKPSEFESDNEYADAELEEALLGLTLDNDGHLKESSVKIWESRHRRDHDSVRVEPIGSDDDDDGLFFDTALRAGAVNGPIEAQIHLGTDQADAKSSTGAQNLDLAPKQVIESPEFIAATDWARDYLQTTIPSPKATTPSRIRATIPHLRAYHMWHHQHMAVEKIAEHLREPPLSLSTVQGYILQGITMEKLEYDRDSLKDVVSAMPISQKKGRWKWLAEKLGAL
ncbi:hypothetical protein NX059_007437 [Plenodomus lindquistii]|nr:hypothetical protein NX059_007437 [Plenodomus lindquistii]